MSSRVNSGSSSFSPRMGFSAIRSLCSRDSESQSSPLCVGSEDTDGGDCATGCCASTHGASKKSPNNKMAEICPAEVCVKENFILNFSRFCLAQKAAAPE